MYLSGPMSASSSSSSKTLGACQSLYSSDSNNAGRKGQAVHLVSSRQVHPPNLGSSATEIRPEMRAATWCLLS
ncbi:Os08g0424600 [Oryza sativa Japonica Group]|uniref:Os08g0424600 protein n=1 Tax=Oryza sativa subsp. japonica TaxID=39947 RepID=A0A0P0XGD1_ORYSJ|nr:Os08g0424600 [Oryza sativa Japonica Group]